MSPAAAHADRTIEETEFDVPRTVNELALDVRLDDKVARPGGEVMPRPRDFAGVDETGDDVATPLANVRHRQRFPSAYVGIH
jgi:hypothetical protein